MKIIITESQYNLLFETKSVNAAQTLINMAVDDYIESCDKMKAFQNIQLALYKGLKKGTVKLEVTSVEEKENERFEDKKYFVIHLILYVDQEWMLENSYYEKFETTLALKIEHFLGIFKYFCYIDEVKMIDNLTKENFSLLQENDKDFNKTKSLITSMFEQDYTIDDIKKITGLSYDIIILCLKNKKVIKDPGNCIEIHEMLYNYLWYTDFIEKNHIYDDGSEIDLDLDSMSRSLSYDFYSNEGNRLYGYATLLWDGDCDWPLDGEEFTWGEKSPFIYNEYYGNVDFYIETYDEFNKIETLQDIINFFNKYYFKFIKKPIEHLIERYLIQAIEMDEN
jgi:hypothetical protein